MNCYLSRNYNHKTDAGKAKLDYEQIFREMGCKNVGLRQTTYDNVVISFLITLIGVLKSPFSIHKGDVLILQYPVKKYFALIHDLGSFRRKKITITQEIKRLNHADCVIAANDNMREWLTQNGCKTQLVVQEIHDYLSETTANSKASVRKPFSVVYAGQLSPRKNSFLYELLEHIHAFEFYIYGYGFLINKAKRNQHVHYMGHVNSDDLIVSIKGDFGLIWDGDSISGCKGALGEYLRYNNPYKTSLYIRSELPVIVWSDSALAGFVRENEIGICVNSLSELNDILESITEQQYMEMKTNTARISKLLQEGHFIQKAITRALDSIGR